MINEVDAVLVLNFKANDEETSISADEIIDMYEAFQKNKPIFVYNQINNKRIKKELEKFNPIFINGDVKKIIDPFTRIYPILTYLSENGEQLLDIISIKLGIDKQQCDQLLNQAQEKGWIYIDRLECFENVGLTDEGIKKINPRYFKQYGLKPFLVGGIK